MGERHRSTWATSVQVQAAFIHVFQLCHKKGNTDAGVMGNWGTMGTGSSFSLNVVFILIESDHKTWKARRTAGLSCPIRPQSEAVGGRVETKPHFNSYITPKELPFSCQSQNICILKVFPLFSWDPSSALAVGAGPAPGLKPFLGPSPMEALWYL